jgi:hypothetical protein
MEFEAVLIQVKDEGCFETKVSWKSWKRENAKLLSLMLKKCETNVRQKFINFTISKIEFPNLRKFVFQKKIRLFAKEKRWRISSGVEFRQIGMG